jgi:hypothetical protein
MKMTASYLAEFLSDSFLKEAGVITAAFPPFLHVSEAAGMAGGGLILDGLTRLSVGGDSWLWDFAFVLGVPIVDPFSWSPSCVYELQSHGL